MKRTALFSYLKQKKFDLVCLEETCDYERHCGVGNKQWGGRIFFYEGTNRSKGELILVSKHFSVEVNIELKLDRILVVSVLYGEHDLIVANVYAANDSREKISFFKNLQELLGDFSEKTLMVCGDFNLVARNELDIISGLPHRINEVNQFNKLINDLGLKDGWRNFHPGENDFTWSRLNPFLAHRLDVAFFFRNSIELMSVVQPCNDPCFRPQGDCDGA